MKSMVKYKSGSQLLTRFCKELGVTLTFNPSEVRLVGGGSRFGLLAQNAPPSQQAQPRPQDVHSGVAPPPPPPPPRVAQKFDWTRFLEGMVQLVAQHRDAPAPQGGHGRVLREFFQFQPPQFKGQPDPDVARPWLDTVERTFRSMECAAEERSC
ncbi:hypothetical protein Taro_032688 [Colocasia esculenta]|uniref:Uncharacterized protein n=1 Tax=Colocasia esculenta TaxID=4460 RepID=A0A843VTA8_COLES|nr:hypothetical protein [Colocasia esculenta]